MHSPATIAALTKDRTGHDLAAVHLRLASELTSALPTDTDALLSTVDRIGWHRSQAAWHARRPR